MNNIECKHCNTTKPEDQFAWKKKNVRRSTKCKECHALYVKEHYNSNKYKYIYSAKLSKRKWAQQLQELKGSTPCADCNKQYPYYQMEFDHLPLFTKRGSPRRYWKKELLKCEIVCALCHAERTHFRLIGMAE